MNTYHTTDLSNSTFLVTGGAGFIGSNLVSYLVAHGAGKVRVLDNLSTGFLRNIEQFVSEGKVSFLEGDIRDKETCTKACDGVDYVLHQAALGSVPRSIKDPITTNAVNTDGFLNVLVAAHEKGVKRLVYASSSSVYGDELTLPKRESLTGNLLSPYAVTKKVNELYAEVFSQIYGLELIGLRYFNIFGPNQSPKGEYAALIPKFIKAIIEGNKPEIYGDGAQARDFTYVSNAVQANIRSLFVKNPEALGQVYNIAVGDNTSVNQLFDLLAKTAGSDLKPVHVAPRKGDIRDSLADISKAEKLLNYKPEVKVEKGLQLTYNWFLENQAILLD